MSAEAQHVAGAIFGTDFLALSPLVWREIMAGGAVVITLVGVRLCWCAPRYRMSIEERAKDGIFTDEQARRKIRFMGWFGPAVTIAGCALLGVVILR